MLSPNADQAKQLIESSQTIALFGHDNPDGDAIGSMLALMTVLQWLGKKVESFCSPLPSRLFNFVAGVEKIRSDFKPQRKYDLIIFVDFSGYDRIGHFSAWHYDYFDEKALLIIDHHYGDTSPHAVVIKDTHADSNCEWLFEHLRVRWPECITRDVASYLYLGIATDTGNFVYDKQWSRSLRNAADLVDLGANKRLISEKLFDSINLAQLQFLTAIMSRYRMIDGVGCLWYSHGDFERLGIDREEASGYITSVISKIVGQDLALIAKIDPGVMRVSLRSKHEKVNASAIAEQFGWWGHFYAAGASIKGELRWEEKERLVELEKVYGEIQTKVVTMRDKVNEGGTSL